MISGNRFRIAGLAAGAASLLASTACSAKSSNQNAPENENGSGDVFETEHPNVLLIMTDQQSFNTIGALAGEYPGAVYSRTPNIDRLVREGISFTRTYCANPVSVPSRFTLFTGMYGGQFGVRKNADTPEEQPIRELQAEKAMGNVFKAAGYETFYAGKVHLPYSNKKAGATTKFAAPDGYGFDTYLTDNEREGLAAEAARFLNEKASGKDGKPFILVASFINPHDICVEYQTNTGTEIADDPAKPEKSQTIRTIREKMNGYDRERFLSEIAPALPENFEKPEGYPATKCSKKRFMDYPDDYWKQYRWVYRELVSLVDSHIGIILDALDANPELNRKTLVVFTSDHGDMQGAHRLGVKSMPFDECQRVPLIFSGCNVKTRGTDATPVCNGVDLLPTLCDLCNIEMPQNMDGVSLSSVIREGKATGALKSRKYIYSESETFVSIYDGKYKMSYFDLDGEYDFLIDMESDGGEMTNISSRMPETINALKQAITDKYYLHYEN